MRACDILTLCWNSGSSFSSISRTMSSLTSEQCFTKTLFAPCRAEHGQWCVPEPLCSTDAVNVPLPKLNQRENINCSYPSVAGAWSWDFIHHISTGNRTCSLPVQADMLRSDTNVLRALALAEDEGGWWIWLMLEVRKLRTWILTAEPIPNGCHVSERTKKFIPSILLLLGVGWASVL